MAALIPAVALPGIKQTSIWAPNPKTERGAHTQIYLTNDGKKLSYTLGRNVIIRSVENPADITIYQEHLQNATVAVVSPTGHYVASGDEAGKVRVWALTNVEHSLKIEVPIFNGKIFDIAWDPEAKRVCAVGAGKTLKGKAFMWDSGNSLGEIDKHDKTVLSCSYKQTRPYKFVTGGEDNLQNFYNGPPFKWDHSNREHTNFVNCVRYQPNGDKYISVGSDKKAILWDGKTGEKVGELNPADMHKGSLYAAAWSPDGKRIATASGDKTVKIWDAETGKCTKTLAVAEVPDVDDMQCGLDWKGDKLISLSLSGDLNILNPDGDGVKPVSVIQGHQNPVASMAFDSATGNTFTRSSGGEVIGWTKAGVSKRVGKHTKPAERVVVSGGIAVSVGVDNVARFTDCSSLEMDGEVALEGGQPKSLAAAAEDAGLVLVGCTEGINVLRGIRKTQFLKFEKPTTIAVSVDGKSVAVGSEASSELSLYKVEGNTLVADGKIDGFSGKVTAITFSPNGKFLAVADMSKDIKLYEASTRNLLISMFWQVHTSTVLHLKFSPDSSHLASCGVDSSVIIWDPAAKTKYTKTESGHVAGGITGLAWTSDKTIRTSGMDATVRSFDVTFL